MTKLMNTVNTALWNISNHLGFKDILDILIVAVIIYELIMLTHKTRGSAVLKGLVLLLVITGVSTMTGLVALNWFLRTVLENGALVLIILFQPELRKALEQIGRGTFLRTKTDVSKAEADTVIDQIVSCLLQLSRRRVGALIVFERKTGLNDIAETGTRIDSTISAALLENIFEPKTPLHDGAVLISGDRISAAACILTLTEAQVSHDLGTRHRAGIGVTETTDALVLIVSEETGIISMAEGGQITRYLNESQLRSILSGLYVRKEHFSIRSLLSGRKEGE